MAHRGLIIGGLCAWLGACRGESPASAALMGEPPSCEAMLGCMSEHNLAAVVDRPDDLIVPRREGRRDAVRREAVLSAWRADAKAPAAPSLPAGAAQP